MNKLSPDDGFPTRLFCASLARLFMLFLLLLALLLRNSVPSSLPVQAMSHVAEGAAERQQRVQLRLEPGESLATLLVRQGLDLSSAQELIRKLRPFVNARALRIGHEVDLVIDPKKDRVRGFEMVVRQRVVRAAATADGWRVDPWPLPFEPELKVLRGFVGDDFAGSVIRAGLAPEHVRQLQKIFAADVDLRSEAVRGAAFTVILSKRFDAAAQRSSKRISAASLEIGAEYYSAFAHGEARGQPRFFDQDGIRLPRRFLAAPLEYERISSTFNLARPDPITGRVRPHQAIDYVAVEGTPVIAVARGVVEFAGWNGGYGYLIEINHGDGYVSSYGHLSAFGDDVTIGKRVHAGDVIGHVGDTGYSTGPHLHFEFSRDREKLDYLTARIDAGERLAGSDLRYFHIARDEKLAAMRDENLQISQLPKLPSY